MDVLYIIDYKNYLKFEKIKHLYQKSEILFFSESYLLPNQIFCNYEVLTSAYLASLFIQNQEVATNNIDKASNLNLKVNPNANIYLVFRNPIDHLLETQYLYIIEKNETIDRYDNNKLFFLAKWPIFLEYLRFKYPKKQIKTLFKEDEKFFCLENYQNLLKLEF